MRFAELCLERYGRFEDHRLHFRAGSPDFHIIYGPNEAGKTTTLSAVSDLLFGFANVSPYNFRFDYNLMRIAAVLEEDGRSLACRRLKKRDKSLVDETDAVIGEGQLAVLLHGLTRETYGSGFSLDQAGLRRGGEAMVKANDDLGQALFAAGSGLTGVAAHQAALEEEYKAIWSPRGRDRTFTKAEQRYEESQRNLREHLLRPREWSEARAAVGRHEQAVGELIERQAALSAERLAVERLRRIGPSMRLRAALSAEIAGQEVLVEFTAPEEDRAETALAAHATAAAERLVAERLRDEAASKLETLSPDAITDQAAEIEALVERRGAVTKAADDLGRLQDEQAEMAGLAASLRTELGIGDDIPSAQALSRLRSIATRHANSTAAYRAHEESLVAPRARAQALRQELAAVPLAEGLGILRAAIARAQGLGSDFDTRCADSQAMADQAWEEAGVAMARLSPWTGDWAALARLQTLDEPEIQAAQDRRRDLAATLEEERKTTRRLEEEAEQTGADRDRLTATGHAVGVDELASARANRDALWREIEGHLQGRPDLPAPAATGRSFAAALSTADDLADRRFDTADASAQLALLDVKLASLSRQLMQVEKRATDAQTGQEAAWQEWFERLSAAALPPLEPVRLRHWQTLRTDALEKQRAALDTGRQAARNRERRAEAMASLREAIESEPPPGDSLSALLDVAEREKAAGEKLEQAYSEKHTMLAGLEEQIAGIDRLMEQERRQVERAATDWNLERGAVGLPLDLDNVDSRLAQLDELRAQLDRIGDHGKRIRGIIRDQEAFADAVTALAGRTQTAADADPLLTLDSLRNRLARAQAVAQAMRTLTQERDGRQQQVDIAEAEGRKALAVLAPILARAGLDDPAALPALIAASRRHRDTRTRLAAAEVQILSDGDGHALLDLAAAWEASDPDETASRARALEQELAGLAGTLAAAADALGAARRAFASLDERPHEAADDEADACAAQAEMAAQADLYVLKRTQSLMLRWAMDRYRERRQDPLLRRASDLFRTLTLGRFSELKIDHDSPAPRLLGLRDDGAALVPIDGMSEGTVDQLFLALRLAAVEQSIAAGVRVPFLADDLFVNFDDDRAMAGLRVLADLAGSTQVLFFTHHAHLCNLGRRVLGADILSEHALA